ncbi:MAG: aminopeptidase, partial [Candidatus Diapherotrites archaeon]
MAEEKKSKEAEALKKKLEWKKESAWTLFDEKTKKEAMRFAESYKEFMADYKTEYEIVDFIKREARKKGFKPFNEASFKAGSKFWIDNRGRSLFLFVLGSKPISDGMKLIGSHIDANRLDLKPSPAYSDSGLGMLNLPDYGGIKQWHWVNVPLALHGHFFDSEGKRHDICYGERESEPTFLITDLLPHIGKALLEKKMEDVISGESLDAIASNTPFHEKEAQDRVQLQLQKMLFEKF